MTVIFDPRTFSSIVYEALSAISQNANDSVRKEQKSQAQELYTYLSTWGLMRLKAEEKALSQPGKKAVVKKYFKCLEDLSGVSDLSLENGLEILKTENLNADNYLGLTGIALELANEFSFWANAIYHDV